MHSPSNQATDHPTKKPRTMMRVAATNSPAPASEAAEAATEAAATEAAATEAAATEVAATDAPATEAAAGQNWRHHVVH